MIKQSCVNLPCLSTFKIKGHLDYFKMLDPAIALVSTGIEVFLFDITTFRPLYTLKELGKDLFQP